MALKRCAKFVLYILKLIIELLITRSFVNVMVVGCKLELHKRLRSVKLIATEEGALLYLVSWSYSPERMHGFIYTKVKEIIRGGGRSVIYGGHGNIGC